MAPPQSASFPFQPNPALPAEVELPGANVEALGSWRLALRRLRRNRVALVALGVFLAIVACSLAAPLYSHYVARVGPNENNLTGKFERDGKRVYVVSPPPDSKPVGPGLTRRYLLGADQNGRDVMVRLLYGARNSLFIGIVSALITTLVAVALGLAAGYLRGPVDAVVRTAFDVIWSFPVLLLAIALGTALALGGLDLGVVTLQPDSLWIPTLVIATIFIPYLGRPIRGQVLALREQEFVESAIAQGMSSMRIMVREILPNLASTILVFSTLIVANNILTEAGLSFLGAGVQRPDPSWGNLIGDGVEHLSAAPHLAIVPGLAIALTVLSLNVFGDGLRDALDPRARARRG
ncbi:MAG: peptide/nickel transport system permease protein [Solirubrobacteraceae bacterium]|nr:peptide/nickel transport system permease protein [Solirubrobacteraceae bacterium]